MDPKIIIIIAVSYLYGFFEVFMNLRQRGQGKIATSGDKSSLWWLYGLITVGYALLFSIGATKIGRIYEWNTFFAIGMALFVIGFVIRIHSILTLKQYFTYSVAKVENHKIIETGLYKFIRRPGYLGQLIIFIGISTSISNWLSILSHDDPSHFWISLPNKSRGKIHAGTTGRRLLELSKANKKNNPNDLLMHTVPDKRYTRCKVAGFVSNALTVEFNRQFSAHREYQSEEAPSHCMVGSLFCCCQTLCSLGGNFRDLCGRSVIHELHFAVGQCPNVG